MSRTKILLVALILITILEVSCSSIEMNQINKRDVIEETCCIVKYPIDKDSLLYQKLDLETSVLIKQDYLGFDSSPYSHDIVFQIQNAQIDGIDQYFRLYQDSVNNWNFYIDQRKVELRKSYFSIIEDKIENIPFGNFNMYVEKPPKKIEHFHYRKNGELYMSLLNPDINCDFENSKLKEVDELINFFLSGYLYSR